MSPLRVRLGFRALGQDLGFRVWGLRFEGRFRVSVRVWRVSPHQSSIEVDGSRCFSLPLSSLSDSKNFDPGLGLRASVLFGLKVISALYLSLSQW